MESYADPTPSCRCRVVDAAPDASRSSPGRWRCATRPATRTPGPTWRGCPPSSQRVDGWIDDGLLGGQQPNAADLQIGSTIRLLASIGDVRPLIEGRPAAALSRYFPPLRGEVPPGALPAQWIPRAAPRPRRARPPRRAPGPP